MNMSEIEMVTVCWAGPDPVSVPTGVGSAEVDVEPGGTAEVTAAVARGFSVEHGGETIVKAGLLDQPGFSEVRKTGKKG